MDLEEVEYVGEELPLGVVKEKAMEKSDSEPDEQWKGKGKAEFYPTTHRERVVHVYGKVMKLRLHFGV